MNPIKVTFKPSAFPKLLADLSHSNQFLKVFAVGSLAVSVLLATLTVMAFSRKPVVIALTSQGAILRKTEIPDPEAEVREAIQSYIERRYNWDKGTVDKNLDSAKVFVAKSLISNFQQGVANVRKFSKERTVSQRAYPNSITVDLKRGVATISGDRITEIQGVRAAGAFNLELTFQGGSRSAENPWGVYIVRESEK